MKEGTNKELHTYRAVIHGDRVEWISGKPKTHMPIDVKISVWEEPWGKRREDKEKGKRLAGLFEKLAEKGTFADIEDPVAWQRETRKDRPLPERD